MTFSGDRTRGSGLSTTGGAPAKRREARTGATASNLDADAPTAVIPWQERPFLKVQTAATLLACSPAKIYALANAGKLTLANVTGRTSVRTEGVVKLMHDAQPWAPGNRNKAAVAERQRRAAARIAS